MQSNHKVLILMSILILQSCSPTEFSYVQYSLAGKYGAYGLLDAIQFTDLNKPVNFKIEFKGDAGGMALSLAADGALNEIKSANGTLKITDAAAYAFKYTPNTGFRGKDDFTIYSRDRMGEFVTGAVTVVVANPLTALQPAMAARGISCVACHLKTASTIITDFGLGGDGKGNDYGFGGDHWDSGSPYGDQNGSALSTIKFTSDKAAVIVPQGRLSAAARIVVGDISLADYFRAKLKEILPGDLEKPLDTITLNTPVIEKTKVYIGAPTQAQLRAQFSIKAGENVFFKNDEKSKALSGLVSEGGIFRTTGSLVCDGDLAIDGTLYLKDLNIETVSGCRLYVTGSVFIYGGINYVNKTQNSNLQISSAKGIFMGLGSVMNADNTGTCEGSGGWYYNNFTTLSREHFDDNFKSSFVHRVRTLWTIPTTSFRENKSGEQIGDDLVSEFDQLQAKVGALPDATCTPAGRNIAFERLFLNAPNIQSRYNGQFTGAIVAEWVLMSLSQFAFSFDSVFSNNAILPMLDSNLYLEIN